MSRLSSSASKRSLAWHTTPNCWPPKRRGTTTRTNPRASASSCGCITSCCGRFRYYYSNNGTAAYSTAMLVKKSDPYVPRSVPIQISSLVDLRRKPELFRLAHAMVRFARATPADLVCPRVDIFVVPSFRSTSDPTTRSRGTLLGATTISLVRLAFAGFAALPC